MHPAVADDAAVNRQRVGDLVGDDEMRRLVDALPAKGGSVARLLHRAQRRARLVDRVDDLTLADLAADRAERRGRERPAAGAKLEDPERPRSPPWQGPRRPQLRHSNLSRGAADPSLAVARAGGYGLQRASDFRSGPTASQDPMFNAVHHDARIGLYENVNAGWALDGGQGLVVPVIHDADRKTVHEIAAVMERHVEAYLEGKLTLDDLAGATFTVTDLSGLGVSFFEPLIPPGQAAILGIGKGPDYEGETILHLTLAFDHQLSEGRKAAEFLQDLRERLEIHASMELRPRRRKRRRICIA